MLCLGNSSVVKIYIIRPKPGPVVENESIVCLVLCSYCILLYLLSTCMRKVNCIYTQGAQLLLLLVQNKSIRLSKYLSVPIMQYIFFNVMDHFQNESQSVT